MKKAQATRLATGWGVFLWVAASISSQAAAQGNAVVHVVNDRVGINDPSPPSDLTVRSSGTNQESVLFRSSDGQRLVRFYETTGTGALFSLFDGTEGERFRISGTGTPNWFSGPISLNCSQNNSHHLMVHAGVNAQGVDCTAGAASWIDAGDAAWSFSSSREIKENIVPLEVNGVLSSVESAVVYSYDFIDGPQDKIGLMAEDFARVLGTGDGKTIHGGDISMALWLAVQELIRENRELKGRVEELEQAQR